MYWIAGCVPWGCVVTCSTIVSPLLKWLSDLVLIWFKVHLFCSSAILMEESWCVVMNFVFPTFPRKTVGLKPFRVGIGSQPEAENHFFGFFFTVTAKSHISYIWAHINFVFLLAVPPQNVSFIVTKESPVRLILRRERHDLFFIFHSKRQMHRLHQGIVLMPLPVNKCTKTAVNPSAHIWNTFWHCNGTTPE